MTQTEFNLSVFAVISAHLEMMAIAADMRRIGDPAARRLEEEQIFVNNIIGALSSYDVTSGLIVDDEIDLLLGWAAGAVQKFP